METIGGFPPTTFRASGPYEFEQRCFEGSSKGFGKGSYEGDT